MRRDAAIRAYTADIRRVAEVTETNSDLVTGYLVCAWMIDGSTRVVTTACCVGHALAHTAHQHVEHADEYPTCERADVSE